MVVIAGIIRRLDNCVLQTLLYMIEQGKNITSIYTVDYTV